MKRLAVFTLIQIILLIPITIYSQGSWKILGDKNSARGKTIMKIVVDDLGNVWFLTSIDEYQKTGKICQFTTSGEWNYFKNNKKVHNSKFADLNKDFSGKICAWKKNSTIYTHDGASWKIDESTIDRFGLNKFGISADEIILFVSQDSVNGIWLETTNGLLLCKNNSFERYFQNKKFSINTIGSFNKGYFIDGTNILKFENDEFINIRNLEENVSIEVGGVSVEHGAWFFISSEEINYISCYKDNAWKDFDYEENIKPTFYFRPDGTTWIKGDNYIGYINNAGLLIKLPIDFLKIQEEIISLTKAFHPSDALSANIDYSRSAVTALKMVFDRNSNVYISCGFTKSKRGWTDFKNQGVLIHYDGNKIQYPLLDELTKRRNSKIRDMLIDERNNLWLLTGSENISQLYNRSAALIQVSGDSTKVFAKSEGITPRVINNLVEDKQGRIWIGSTNKGFFMYEYEN